MYIVCVLGFSVINEARDGLKLSTQSARLYITSRHFRDRFLKSNFTKRIELSVLSRLKVIRRK